MKELDYILNKYKIQIPTDVPVRLNEGREFLPGLFAELGYLVGAEIGTEKGKYAERLCKANPNLHLYCIDSYSEYPGYDDYVGDRDGMLKFAKKDAAQRLANFNVDFIYKFSMDALADIPDESLDFCYIDANHQWPFVCQDIYYWSKKVRSGGIVSGHDFDIVHNNVKGIHVDVRGAVIGYANSFNIYPWFITSANHTPSWFWVQK